MSQRFAPFAALALSLLSACGQAGPEPGGDLELGSTSQAMLGGELSDDSFGGVVFLETQQTATRGLACTGTLIAPNLVATALHCVTTEILGYFNCLPDGSLSATSTVADSTLGPLVPPGNVKVYTGSPVSYGEPAAVGQRLLGTGSTQACQGDLAFIVLDRDLDLPTVPVRLDKLVGWRESINVLGYGLTDNEAHESMRVIREVEVLDVGPATMAEPTRSQAPRTFTVGTGPCKGDSGGPALAQDTRALLGVFSLNTSRDCAEVGGRAVYTSMMPFSQLVLDAYEAAGVEPNLENGLPPEPEGPRKSTRVSEQGCALAAPRAAMPPWALAALGLAASGLWLRRRRSAG